MEIEGVRINLKNKNKTITIFLGLNIYWSKFAVTSALLPNIYIFMYILKVYFIINFLTNLVVQTTKTNASFYGNVNTNLAPESASPEQMSKKTSPTGTNW